MKNLIKKSIYWVFVILLLALGICGYLLLISLLLIADIIFIPLCFSLGLFRWSMADRESLSTSINKEFEILYDLHYMIITMPFGD